MKTLVIHPKDDTTDMLSIIYAGKDWTVITDPAVSKSVLRREINAHDRIVMLGHGSEKGLYGLLGNSGRLIIDANFVQLLREKRIFAVWCNADIFVRKYNLKGFYTGMIISEMDEAYLYSMQDFNYRDIDESNDLISEALKQAVDSDNILLTAKELYHHQTNPIILFNMQNLYQSVN